MASIQSRKHKDGSVTHRVLWRDGGRQRSLTFEDITSAEGFRSNIDAYGSTEALAILDITDTSDEQTLGEWVDQYVDTLAGIGDGTRKQYRRYAAHDLAALRPLPLPAITETTVKKWLLDLEVSKAAGKTVQNKHAFLSGALKAAVRGGLIDRNPCEGQRIKRTERREMVMLSRDEFDQVHAAIGRELWADLAMWLVSTGMRFGEATALRATDVDLDAGTCRIARAWKRSEQGWEVGPPKTRRSVRTINLPAPAVDVARTGTPLDVLGERRER
jgi:integrase